MEQVQVQADYQNKPMKDGTNTEVSLRGSTVDNWKVVDVVEWSSRTQHWLSNVRQVVRQVNEDWVQEVTVCFLQ